MADVVTWLTWRRGHFTDVVPDVPQDLKNRSSEMLVFSPPESLVARLFEGGMPNICREIKCVFLFSNGLSCFALPAFNIEARNNTNITN